jgi:hypothetical protein
MAILCDESISGFIDTQVMIVVLVERFTPNFRPPVGRPPDILF